MHRLNQPSPHTHTERQRVHPNTKYILFLCRVYYVTVNVVLPVTQVYIYKKFCFFLLYIKKKVIFYIYIPSYLISSQSINNKKYQVLVWLVSQVASELHRNASGCYEITYFPSVCCSSDAGKIKVTCDNLQIFYYYFHRSILLLRLPDSG